MKNKTKLSRVIAWVVTFALSLSLAPIMPLSVQAGTPTATVDFGTQGALTWSSGTAADHLCAWADPFLTINDGANIIITGTWWQSRRIRIAEGATASITLYNLSLDNTGGSYLNTISLEDNAKLTLTIEGTNTLTASSSGAGIRVPQSATLIINGTGSVTITGGNNAAGIGLSSYDSSDTAGTIIIQSATVTAIGGINAAGIGGDGSGGNGGAVTIQGGVVTATGGTNATGIGSGRNGTSHGTLTLNGDGVLFASSIDASRTNTRGIVFMNNTGTFYGNAVTITDNVEIPQGHSLDIPAGATLTIPSGKNIHNLGTVTNNGTINRGGSFGTWTGNPVEGDIVFVPVTNIDGVDGDIAANRTYTLSGTITPSAATEQTIVWSVQNAGSTGATVSGDTLTATAAGTVTVRATIANGLTETTDYIQDFVINVYDFSSAIALQVANPPLSGPGWSYASGNYTVFDGADVTFTGTSAGERHIDVAEDSTANITLDGVSMVNAPLPTLRLGNGATLALTVNGTNTLTAGSDRAGIQAPDGTTLTINGTGSLTATGGFLGAGIGGGNGQTGGNITIGSGTVVANGGNAAAGIGGGGASSGNGGNGGSISITGGNVTARGGASAASIGGGGGAGGSVNISGGIVAAQGGANAAGIGGGRDGAGGTVIINGGTVTATTSGVGGSGIGGGADANSPGTLSMNGGGVVIAASVQPTGGSLTATSGILFDGNTGTFYGNEVIITDNVTIPAGHTLTIPENAVLTIPGGKTIHNNGNVINNGFINRGGTYGTWTGAEPFGLTNIIDLSAATPDALGIGWNFANNVYTIENNANVTVRGTTSGARSMVVNGTAGITLDGASISITGLNLFPAIRLTSGADVTLTLATDSSNTVMSGGNSAGVEVHENAKLTISGTGALSATGGAGGAGIGSGVNSTGGRSVTSGEIVINSGSITATGGAGTVDVGAGIGGGGSTMDTGGKITINGGNVTAIAGNNTALAMGAGSNGAVYTVTVDGRFAYLTNTTNTAPSGTPTINLFKNDNTTFEASNNFRYIKLEETTVFTVFTVEFDTDGGGTIADLLALDGDTITAPTAPTKTGYTFGGWYKEAACTNEWNFATETVTEDITLYAKWIINTYTITATAGTGGTVTGSGTFDHGATVTLTATPNNGYTFDGWYENDTKITAANATYSFTATENRTLQARFTASVYTITYNLDGGTQEVGDDWNSYTFGTGLTLPTPTRTNWTFGGWYDNAALTGTEVTAISTTETGNKTFWAKWICEHSSRNSDNCTVCDNCDATGLPRTCTDGSPCTFHTCTHPNLPTAWSVRTAATCEVDGLEARECPDCPHEVTQTIPKLGHDFRNYTNNTATCTADGVETAVCERDDCDETDERTTVALGHDMPNIWIVRNAPTCDTAGEEYRQCARYSVCNHEETRPITALTHTWATNADGTHKCTTVGGCGVLDEPCSPNGMGETCTKCGFTTLDPTCEHNNTTTTQNPVPTCISGGTEIKVCADCSGTISSTPLDALGHNFEVYTSDNNATCTQDGTETAVCERCTVTNTRTVANSALGHSFQIYTSDNNATCTVNGTETAVCERCTITDTRTVANSMLPHSFGVWTVTTPATETTTGLETRICTICNTSENRTIPATGGGGGNGDSGRGDNGNGGRNANSGSNSTGTGGGNDTQPSGHFQDQIDTFARGSGEALTLTIDIDFANFREVRRNGLRLTEGTHYTAKSGSTIITLLPEYLDKLEAGEHNLSVHFKGNVVVNLAFTVAEYEDVSSAAGIVGNVDNIGFGAEQTSVIQILVAVGVISGAGVCVVKVRRKRKVYRVK
ncbi:MAG: InlB B-repeat-containing protein [Oscillospiraceae bacterium]|nr:InlB B-repeat-containing protein [Oscillospiraceae bacterium]